MLATWIEAAAKGRHGGQVRAGMWSAVVVGTHPIEADQEVWLELNVDDVRDRPSCRRSGSRTRGSTASGTSRSRPRRSTSGSITGPGRAAGGSRPPARSRTRSSGPTCRTGPRASDAGASPPEGLVGNQMMTVRVDSRGATHDVYFPTVGLHSDVRPAEGELPQSRSHFRAIVAGLAIGRRLDWFGERLAWGGVPALPGGDEPPDDRASLAARANPGAGDRLRRQGGLPAQDRRRDRDPRPVHQAVPRLQRRDRADRGRLRRLRSRPRSTAGSASPA